MAGSETKTELQEPWYFGEKRMTFGQLAKKLGVNTNTVVNWVDNGVKIRGTTQRAHLERANLGGAVFTTWEAFMRFDQMLNG